MSQTWIVAARTRVGGLQAITGLDTNPQDAGRAIDTGDHNRRELPRVLTTGEDK